MVTLLFCFKIHLGGQVLAVAIIRACPYAPTFSAGHCSVTVPDVALCWLGGSFNSHGGSGDGWYNSQPCAECKNETIGSLSTYKFFSFQPGGKIIFVILCVCSHLNLMFPFPEKLIFAAGQVFAEFA